MSNYSFNIPRLFKAFRSSRSFSSLVRVLLSSVVCCFQILYNVKKKMNSFPKLCMKRRMWRETADGSSSSLTSVLFYFPSITRLSVRPVCPSDPAVRPTRLSSGGIEQRCRHQDFGHAGRAGRWVAESLVHNIRVLITKLSNTAAWFNLYSVKK